MKPFQAISRSKMTATVLACVLAIPCAAFAKSPVKMIKLDGIVDIATTGPAPYQLEGIASHLGQYEAYGEVEFLPGEEEGSLSGTGPVVFEAANGDLLVGTATWEIDAAIDGESDASIHFGWQESVEFSDGTVVFNTGRFVTNRPPGLAVDARIMTNTIILILIIIFS